jgi:hypothetical protein
LRLIPYLYLTKCTNTPTYHASRTFLKVSISLFLKYLLFCHVFFRRRREKQERLQGEEDEEEDMEALLTEDTSDEDEEETVEQRGNQIELRI